MTPSPRRLPILRGPACPGLPTVPAQPAPDLPVRARRRLLAWGLGLGVLAAAAPRAARAGTDDAMVEFDLLYIPPLFLTGQAGRGPDGAAQALAALDRLQSRWPALRQRLQAVWPRDAGWRRTLATVQRHLAEAGRHARHGAWADSHEALEQVRLVLMAARAARGHGHVLDRYVAFHGSMEAIVAVAAAAAPSGVLPAERREALAAEFATARALWHRVEGAPIDAVAWALSPAREARLRRGLADETQALQRLSEALRGRDDAALLKAAAAIKPPFVRAYTAFGLDPGEAWPR